MSASICIVALRYLASTPRVVKEADALTEAGHDVTVICAPGGLEETRQHGDKIVEERDWEAIRIGWSPERSGERWTYWKSTLRQRLAQFVPESLWPYVSAPQVESHRLYPEGVRSAVDQAADLYIGHYPAGLATAAYAAQKWGAHLAYDAEDFHVGEAPDDQNRVDRIDFIEGRYLPGCSYVTAASEGIARALAERYGIESPIVINNVFPWSERASIDETTKDRCGDELSLYWFSQTIGMSRGIQDAIRGAGLLESPVQLHFRGALPDRVRTRLMSVAKCSGVADCVYFHPKVPPGELLSRAAEHDVGLALEQGHTPNRRICTTNKLFRYMLAGLAIAATDVPGQRAVLDDELAFSGLYEPGDPQGLASVLRRWTNSEHLSEAQTAALQAARSRWNWERESQKLVHAVEKVLAG